MAVIEEKREYFRVPDVLKISLTKLMKGSPCPHARVIAYPLSTAPQEYTMEGERDPVITKLLIDISLKLDTIIHYICVEKEGFVNLENREINLSAGGLQVRVQDPFQVGDLAEIKMVLPTLPPTYLICYGSVVRVEKAPGDDTLVSLEYVNMDEETRSVLVKYTLARQRQLISK